jgi:pullulanase/glycogen debranching enzyme
MIDDKSDEEYLKRSIRPSESIEVFDLAGSDIQTLRIYLPEATTVVIDIYDNSGMKITPSARYSYQDHGDHYKRINTHKLDSGVYTVRMDTPSGSYQDKMTVP